MSRAPGIGAERLAGWFLRLKGYRILARRYATPLGEIDLVAATGDTLVFVEVKRRSSIDKALEALTARQQARIKRAAQHYLQYHPGFRDWACRFDLVGLAPWRWPRHAVAAWE